MPNLAASSRPGALSTYVFPGGYDSTKLGLGPLMLQANNSGNEGKWAGPIPVSVARPVESIAAIPGIMPDAISWSTQYDWVILADNAVAAATRRFQLWRFDKTSTTSPWAFNGFITASIPSQGTQGVYTIRGQKIVYNKYTTGTVAISNGSASLTGTSTNWSTNRIFVGSRIGFPSVAGDATTVPVWYEISAVGSDTSITLTSNFGETTLAGGSNYIIEDLRVLFVATNSTTAANAGLFMIAGLRYENFSTSGTNISAATTVDKIRATYWLSDGNATSNVTNQTYGGIAIDTATDFLNQNVYCLDAAAGFSRFQVNNFRAAMTLTAGRTAATGAGSTFTLMTGQQAVTGTVSQVDALILATASHGPRSGSKSLYWVTTSRVYSAAISGVLTTSTTFQSGAMVENPPGTSTTFALTAALNSIEYDSLTDRFLILTTGAAGIRFYYTQYREDAGQLDRYFGADNRQLNQSTEDATASIFFSTLSLVCSSVSLGGMCYIITHGTTATTNFMYSLPLGADWEYASSSNSRVVFPALDTSSFATLLAGYISVLEVIGGKTGTNLGIEPSAVRVYYRTSGISDNSGSWTLLDYSGDLASITSSAQIQFMCEFRTLTLSVLPARVTRVAVEGTGSFSDVHFQFSQGQSSLTAKQFSWRLSTAFGTVVPKLYIRIYDAVTGSLLVSDDSVAQASGTWEKSTNGGSSYGAFNTTDKVNETTYIRFTPSSLADNIKVSPVISLA